MANKDTLNAFFESSANTDLNVKIAKSMGWLQSTLTKVLSAKKSTAVEIGKMYTFAYNPIGSETLPYWDRFPLVIVLEKRKDTIVAINVHYIPMKDRLKVFTKLMSTVSTTGLSEKSKLRGALKSIRTVNNYNYMIKQYHGAGVKSAILEIPGNEWGHAITLPYANWVSGNGPDRRMGPFSNGMLKETVSAARKMTEKAAQGIKP